jgi:hypothetical protein
MNILILGCGAIGSRLAIELYGNSLYLLDNDRVGAENIPTSAYQNHQVGQTKVMALSELCYFRGIEATAFHLTFGENHRFPIIPELDVIVDCFDNTVARALSTRVYGGEQLGGGRHLVHAGVSADRLGCVGYDGYFPMPVSEDDTENPVCTHLLGQPILSMTALVAADIIRRWPDGPNLVFVDRLGVLR